MGHTTQGIYQRIQHDRFLDGAGRPCPPPVGDPKRRGLVPKRMDDVVARAEYEQAWRDQLDKPARQIKDRTMTKQQYYWMWSSLGSIKRRIRQLNDGTHPIFKGECFKQEGKRWMI